MKKTLLSLITLITLLKLTLASALAFCPICTVAVGAGLGLSRYLGIDDSVSGIWVGALILSSGLWFSTWLKKKGLRIPYRNILITIAFYILTLIPLYFAKIIGHPFNVILGIDKLIFGTIMGSGLFLLGLIIDKVLRSKNDGKVFFYYQKVIIPMTLLISGSMLLFFLTKK